MTDGALKRHRSRALRVILALAAGVMFAGFFALGTWQVLRLQWKLALIERVGQRVHGAPLPAPPVAQWPQLSAENDDYRRVELRGVLLDGATTQVLASLERGIGYWVVTPLCTQDGGIVMINRGFIPAGVSGWKPQPAPAAMTADACAGATASAPVVRFSGLLRMTEVAGRLRQNEPARNYWYTRDVQAIAQARGLGQAKVAPYFVDADAPTARAAGPVAGEQPTGGLTVISFVNNHLVYAITWYALALMVAAATVWVIRDARKQTS
ncbi:SURF1 family protein [Duganella sp. FT94W]|uniref:SURF1-like protein n=1 Tax=Duganella lactea TaxID=2692173 RepID=A0ABW9V8A2_9BURK|nr:SURF1 family protein [Duganella lactea]MYM35861.1 SURF1 family protein [Duganella lactea]